jgi:hypothetical protein
MMVGLCFCQTRSGRRWDIQYATDAMISGWTVLAGHERTQTSAAFLSTPIVRPWCDDRHFRNGFSVVRAQTRLAHFGSAGSGIMMTSIIILDPSGFFYIEGKTPECK